MHSHQDVALTLGHLCVAFTSKACVQSFHNEDTFVDSSVFPVFSRKHPSISRDFWPMERRCFDEPRENKDFRVNDGKSGRNYKLNREELWVEEEISQTSKNRQVDATKLETKKLTEMEAKIEEKDLEKWRIDVSNAVSGESLGHYLLFPTDLLQDLKEKVQSQLCSDRPWSVNGRLLHQTRVLQEAMTLKDAGIEGPCELQYLLQSKDLEGEILPRNELLLVPEVIQQVLDFCKLKVYQPKVEWVLDEFLTLESQKEVEEMWQKICEDEEVNEMSLLTLPFKEDF